MSAQQKRPLYAFIAISFICCLVIASGVRSKALVSAVTETVTTAVATAPRLSPLADEPAGRPLEPSGPVEAAHGDLLVPDPGGSDGPRRTRAVRAEVTGPGAGHPGRGERARDRDRVRRDRGNDHPGRHLGHQQRHRGPSGVLPPGLDRVDGLPGRRLGRLGDRTRSAPGPSRGGETRGHHGRGHHDRGHHDRRHRGRGHHARTPHAHGHQGRGHHGRGHHARGGHARSPWGTPGHVRGHRHR